MQYLEHYLTMDLLAEKITEKQFLRKGNVGHKLIVRFTEGGREFLPTAAEYFAQFVYERPSGEGADCEMEIVDGRAVTRIPQDALSEVGDVMCNINFYYGADDTEGVHVTSPTFILHVCETIDGTAAEATPSAYQQIMASETARAQAELTRVQAETARQQAEEAREQTLPLKADKTDTVLNTTLSMGRKAGTTVGSYSVALGYDAEASARCAFASGGAVKAGGQFSAAEGYATEATGEAAHAEGYGAKASGSAAHAEGRGTVAASMHQHAQGRYNVSDTGGVYAHIVGNGSDADHRSNCHTLDWSGNAWFAGSVEAAGISVGRAANTTAGAASVAAGRGVEASGVRSQAFGEGTEASGDDSHAEGFLSKARSACAHAEGWAADALGRAAHAEGCFTETESDYAHAEGYSAYAGGEASHAEGNTSSAGGAASHAEGSHTNAAGPAQHVQGRYNVADAAGTYAHIVGNGSDADHRSNCHTLDWSGNAWFAGDVEAAGISVGRAANTTAGAASVAAGRGVEASGVRSQAFGDGTEASGEDSHAEGFLSKARSACAHAEGWAADAQGKAAHAEGCFTETANDYAHAEGYSAYAGGEASHAEGSHTNATGPAQHVQGRYNVADAAGTYAHIVGNGTGDAARSNAHTLDWSGNAWFAGGIELNDTATGTRYRIRVTNGQLVLTALS